MTSWAGESESRKIHLARNFWPILVEQLPCATYSPTTECCIEVVRMLQIINIMYLLAFKNIFNGMSAAKFYSRNEIKLNLRLLGYSMSEVQKKRYFWSKKTFFIMKYEITKDNLIVFFPSIFGICGCIFTFFEHTYFKLKCAL